METIASEIEAIGDELVHRAVAETGLAQGRIEGERGRTCAQLRLFAAVVRAGEWLDVRIDPALPDRSPMPRSDLRQRPIALGPVAVFGASNFPLAFSVAGGDTASQEEVFGSTSLVIECHDADEVRRVAEHLEGQLTATLQMEEADTEMVRPLVPILERKAGRILVNGWPTGVEVGHATVHGGPFPATSDSRTTSVGTAAIFRFLRPVCCQDLPEELRPEAIREANPWALKRLVNGQRES